MAKNVVVGQVEVGDALPAHLVSEIGLNHNGSMELARESIYESAKAGATFVKFQKRTPSDLATPEFLDAPFPKAPLFGRTQREVRERLELDANQLGDLKAYAETFNMVFFFSVFDHTSLALAVDMEIPIIKIASHSITNGPLLEASVASGIPIMASLGGSTTAEADRAVDILKETQLILMHCTSAYPTPDALVRLGTIQYLKDRYGLPVGYSGHESGTTLSLGAAFQGACIIERHFTLARSMPGLDHGISLEPREFASLAQELRRVHNSKGIAVDLVSEELAARNNYHVGVRTTVALGAGDVISEANLVLKQPLTDSGEFFTGLEVADVVGKKVSAPVTAGALIPRALLK